MTKTAPKLVLADTPVTSKQLLRLLEKTPANHKYTRPAKGGGTWDYVTGVYVKKTLNYVFGWLWSFDIISIEEKHNQVVCRGKLTINKPDGTPLIWKTDIGRSDIKFKTEYINGQKIISNNPLDYGNDEKSAATDCLKRCAFQLGIASDIYGKNEFNEISVENANLILNADRTIGGEEKEIDDIVKIEINSCKTHRELITTVKEIQSKYSKEYQKSIIREYMMAKENISEGVKNADL